MDINVDNKDIYDASSDMDAIRGKGLSVSRLKKEKDFFEYLKLLKAFSKRYALFIAVNNVPHEPYFSESDAALFMSVGLRISLYNRTRYPYIAAINAGEPVLELAPSEETVEWEGMVGESKVKLFSVNRDVDYYENTVGIIIDGKDYAPDGRGFNFVLFDPVTQTVVDACCFDTSGSRFSCYRPLEEDKELIEFQESHPGVTVVSFMLPIFPLDNKSEMETFIEQNEITLSKITEDPDQYGTVLNQYFPEKEDLREVLTPPQSYHDLYGVRRFEDTNGKHVNTAGGHRVTSNQPKCYRRSIFILGGCNVFGIGSSDSGTSASHLQRLLNTRKPELGFIVHNYGYFLANQKDLADGEEYTILNSLPVKEGDILLILYGRAKGFPYFDLSFGSARRRGYGEIFFDREHYTEDGHRLIADLFFEKLEQNKFFIKECENSAPLTKPKLVYNGLNNDQLKELETFKKSLVEVYNNIFGVKVGVVAMNCNPFTLGHRYLVEQALLQCDYLFISVVQEDKAFFPFKDRKRLVKEGTADLNNVMVLSSGGFQGSTLTFSEYHNKTELQDRMIDPSLDLILFAQELAPCLNITIRFAGEEPFDNVTRQYNEAMRSLLPQFGIEFVEIPRKKINGTAISASTVRKLLEKGDFDGISPLVPSTTLEYLKGMGSTLRNQDDGKTGDLK